ncbi:MAG: hypothetical protein AAEF72_01150 [Gammaproteobacteria bacterium]
MISLYVINTFDILTKMKFTTILVALLASAFALSSYADTNVLVKSFNKSDGPSELVSSGWVENDGGKNFKIVQIFVNHSFQSIELHIDKSGKIITWINSARSVDSSIDTDVDYQFFADIEDWHMIAKGENDFMYHLTVGGLTFKGPMMEAMSKMQAIDKLLLIIAKNI